MPAFKRKRYTSKRRTKKRRRSLALFRRRKSSRNLILGGFPKSKLVKLRYCEFVTLNAPNTGLAVSHIFVANSMYDPNNSGVGHQPSNFDRWANIYDHFTVVGSKISIQHCPTTTGNIVPSIVGVALTDSGTETSGKTAEQLLEKKLTRSKYRSVGANSNDHGLRKLTHTFSAKKFFGKARGGIVNDGLYRGKMGNFGTGSNPTELAYYELFAVSTNNTEDPDGLRLLVTIDYIAKLTEPKPDDES